MTAPPIDGRTDLFGLDVAALASALQPLGVRPFAARQLGAQIYARRQTDFLAMSDLSSAVREQLARGFTIGRPAIGAEIASSDGTIRYVLSLPAGGEVEAVYIPAERAAPLRGKAGDVAARPGTAGPGATLARRDPRITLCISSQAGCALGCTFCMTATLGLKRHLSAGEVLGQVALLMDRHGLEANRFNIVLMGMGEPLHNYDAVTAALRLLIEPRGGFGIAPRHVTLSTAGLAPAIERLALEPAVPRLAVSLNATTDEVRSRLMPVNRTWPIERLLEACREFLRRTGQLLFLEYVMLDGVNDTPQDLKRLGRIAASLPARVNLIAFNEVAELPFSSSPPERMTRFREGLVGAGVRASIRRSRGRDVSAACGQLAFAASLPAAGPSVPPEARA